jgi:hypothetical protein
MNEHRAIAPARARRILRLIVASNLAPNGARFGVPRSIRANAIALPLVLDRLDFAGPRTSD